MIGFNQVIGGNPASSITGQTRSVADDLYWMRAIDVVPFALELPLHAFGCGSALLVLDLSSGQ